MSPADLVRFSATALRGHRLRTGLSLLGVCIGVSSVILLTSLGEGARLYVTAEFQTLGANLLIVFPGKTETTGMAPIMGGVPHDLTLADAEALARQVPGVRRVAPLTIGTARARAGERSREITVAGTTAEFQGLRKLKIQSGRYLPAGELARGQRVCVIGSAVRRELFPGENPLGRRIRIGAYRYQVIGVMGPRGESLGMDLDEIIHIPVSESLKMFNRTSLFRVLVEVSSPGQMDAARRRALSLLTERHDGEEDVTIITQDSVISTFGSIFDILTAALAGIAAVSLSVAGIGIMNVMLVSVSERTSEIGLLKALGVTRGQVLGAFLVEASLISSAGGLLGLGLGLGAARLLQVFYPDFPAQPPSWAVAGALAVAAAVGIAFGALPARRAARLDPVASLRGG